MNEFVGSCCYFLVWLLNLRLYELINDVEIKDKEINFKVLRIFVVIIYINNNLIIFLWNISYYLLWYWWLKVIVFLIYLRII